jgi:cyclopropane-fatty-acyl-phospholipid synthase
MKVSSVEPRSAPVGKVSGAGAEATVQSDTPARLAQSTRPSKPLLLRHPLDSYAERALRAQLTGLVQGALTLVHNERVTQYGLATPDCPFSVTLRVHDARFYSDVAFGGSVGAGEAYMHGYWSVDDLTALVRILLNNREVLDGMETGFARATAPLRKVLHWAARNTRRGSRRNIGAHYDLGNDFFRLFLDPTLMYSSAIFDRPGMTLEAASIAKMDRICRKLELQPSDHVLEIGTGWGGFALHAAQHYGCHVTTTTISRRQYEMATARVTTAGLSHRVTLLQQDYRDLSGRYDKLVSIEMIEAIGHQYLETYFRKCSALLEPEGLMLLQAITIVDQRYLAALHAVDFIKRYIFPGSFIPSIAALTGAAARASDLRLLHLEDIGPHYATTLRCWRENFFANIDSVRTLGYSEAFIRMWEFYLCYCEGGFIERATGDVHMLWAKPHARPAPFG